MAGVLAGDRDAFAAIYDRYADRIHDFCHSVLRDRAEAADAMQDTFVIAAQRLGQLRDPSKLRAWLFAVARHESLRRARARARAVPTEDLAARADMPGAGPEDEVSRVELRQVVWSAAEGLSERDRALLDLHLRQGLDGQELADAIGVTPGHAYVLMNRLRTQVERALGALLVARLGRDDCADLAEILRGWDGRFSVLVRKRVARHVDRCEVCGDRRKALASPLSLLSAAPFVAAAPGLRERVLGRVELASATSPLPGPRRGGWRRDGFPPRTAGLARPSGGLLAAGAAAVLVAGLVTGGAIAFDGGDGGGPVRVVAGAAGTAEDGGAPATTAPDDSGGRGGRGGGQGGHPRRTTTTSAAPRTTVAPPTTAPVTSTPVVAPPPAPTAPPTTSPATTSPPTTAPPTTSAPATTTTQPEVDDPPTVSIVSIDPDLIYQDGGGCWPTIATVVAEAWDDLGVEGVVLEWSSKTASGSVAMSFDDGLWYGNVGPFSDVYGGAEDTLDLAVVVSDGAHTAQASGAVTLVYEWCGGIG